MFPIDIILLTIPDHIHCSDSKWRTGNIISNELLAKPVKFVSFCISLVDYSSKNFFCLPYSDQWSTWSVHLYFHDPDS